MWIYTPVPITGVLVLCYWLVTIDDTSPRIAQSQLEEAIDNILRYDDTNNNGLIEYAEFVMAMNRNRERYWSN